MSGTRRRVWRLDGAKSGAAWLAARQHLPMSRDAPAVAARPSGATVPGHRPRLGPWCDRPLPHHHPDGGVHRPDRGGVRGRAPEAARSSPVAGVRRLQAPRRHLELLPGPRRRRTGRQDRRSCPRGPPVGVLRRHVVRAHDLRRGQRHHRQRHPGGHRTGAVRGRLGRGQGTPRPGTARHRARTHPRPAPSRRHGRDGHPGPHRPRRRPPARTPLHHRVRPGDPHRPDPRALEPHRHHARHRRPVAHRRPTSNGSCSNPPHGSSTSAPPAGSSPGRCAEPSRSATAPASTDLCDEPPQRPEIDHIVEASKGGLTTQANGRLGCGFHNRWRNHHPDAGPDPPDDG